MLRRQSGTGWPGRPRKPENETWTSGDRPSSGRAATPGRGWLDRRGNISAMAPVAGTFFPFSLCLLETGNAAKGRGGAALSKISALREAGDRANGTAVRAGREGMALLDRSRGCGLPAISHTL